MCVCVCVRVQLLDNLEAHCFYVTFHVTAYNTFKHDVIMM